MNKVVVDIENPDTFVISLLDNKRYTRITHTHTKKYGMSIDEYCRKFALTRQDIVCKELRSKLSWTLSRSIDMYGEEEGKIRWAEYCKKQAISNTFEYKRAKYNITEDEYREYNKSRACTELNFIKRHGEVEGKKKWDEYCKRQAYAGSSEQYFIDLYGEIRGKEIWNKVNLSKKNTLENFIKRYGVIEGKERYQSYLLNKFFVTGVSQVSQLLFSAFGKSKTENIFYDTHDLNKEYYLNDHGKMYFYDYIDMNTLKGVEFNGDIWHGNPTIYSEEDTPNPYQKSLTCKEIWDYDNKKINLIKEKRNIDILVVWENDYKKDETGIIKKCKEFLGYE